MVIDKRRVDKSLRNIRRLYRLHADDALSPSSFATKARTELNLLYIQHTKELIKTTAARFTAEARSYQAQFGLDLECSEVYFTQVARGYRGIRASIHIRSKEYNYFSGSVEVFIGPFDVWDKVAVHTVEERESGNRSSFYTTKARNRWQHTENFDFPELLLRIKEDAAKPAPEYDDEDIPF